MSDNPSIESPPPRPERDLFLDVVRSVALVRVVVWHAAGAAVITWVVSAVPAMFFVTGSLLAKSLSSRSAASVVTDRLRRVLVPLWAFGALVLATLFVVHRIDGTARTALPWRGLGWWVLPLNDPPGTTWEGGYVTAPLWYLRVLVWLFLLGPVLWWLVRRLGWAAVMATLVAGVAALEWLARTDRFTGTLAWRVGDGVLYGVFLVGGFAHRLGAFEKLSLRMWTAIAVAAGALAATWTVLFEIPDYVVNDSHVAHLVVGAGWLAVLFALRPILVLMASTPRAGAVVGLLSRRSLTIYLWHPVAIVVTFLALRSSAPLPYGVHTGALLAGTIAITGLAAVALGWIEDLANGRPARWWPLDPRPARSGVGAPAGRRRPPVVAPLVGVGAVLTILAAAFGSAPASRPSAVGERTAAALPELATARNPNPIGLRVPSRQPKSPAARQATGAAPQSLLPVALTPEQLPRVLGADVHARLTATVDEFVDNEALPGIQIAVLLDNGVEWAYSRGVDLFDEPLTDRTGFDIASATKSFTSALVWQAIDQGRLDPDAPLPTLRSVPEFPYNDVLTVRQLLAHRSGLVNYRATPEYPWDYTTMVTPAEAVTWSGRLPLEFEPGSMSSYSSVNYLVLGLLLEQVTGRSFESQLAELVDRVGLGVARLTPAQPGMPNFSASGLVLNARQLAKWGTALLGGNLAGLSSTALEALTNADYDSTISEGLEGYCPCPIVDDVPQWTAFGYAGSVTLFNYSPTYRISIAVNLSSSLYEPEGREVTTLELIEQLRQIVLE